MPVVEPSGSACQELRAGLEESWIGMSPRDRVWEARITEKQPVVRLLIRDRWWELRLKGFWSPGQRLAWENIVSGAAAGELFFHGLSTDKSYAHSKIKCRLVAWLPRDQIEVSRRPHNAPPKWASQIDPGIRYFEELHIADLREAIRVNRVSFPAQVPTFTKHCRPDLQSRVVQLYFVLGWNSGNIGARYNLSPSRVRQILDSWKRRAVKAGLIQHIPPAEVISQQPTVPASLHNVVAARFAQASFPGAPGSFQNDERGISAW